jgi:hypothetical protein
MRMALSCSFFSGLPRLVFSERHLNLLFTSIANYGQCHLRRRRSARHSISQRIPIVYRFAIEGDDDIAAPYSRSRGWSVGCYLGNQHSSCL